MEFKRVLFVSSSVLGILVVVILIGFSVFNLYKTLAPTWGYGNSMADMPSIMGTCQKFKSNYDMTVTINNYNKEIKDIKCEFASNGGMTADKEKINIPFISQNSSDICDFVLTGVPSKATVVRVTYAKKGLFGYKNFSTIVTPYSDCSSATEPTPPPMSPVSE